MYFCNDNNLNPKIMKTNILKWCFLVVFFFSEFILFAQDTGGAGDTAEDETTNPLESPDTPVNGKIVYLAIAAVVFSVFYFRKNKLVKS